jgi:proteasome lid subunit RPN8/RPN11
MKYQDEIPRINLTPEVENAVRQHAAEAFPNECCGFLYGNELNGRLLSQAVPANNSKDGDQRRRFEISPLDYLRAEQYAEANNTELLGIYHSHPNHPAIASEHDLAVAMPYFSYVIVSVFENETREIKSWKLLDYERKFIEEKVTIIQ